MTTFVGVFHQHDLNQPSVFFGGFANFPDAWAAVDKFILERRYWSKEDFTIVELPFGEML